MLCTPGIPALDIATDNLPDSVANSDDSDSMSLSFENMVVSKHCLLSSLYYSPSCSLEQSAFFLLSTDFNSNEELWEEEDDNEDDLDEEVAEVPPSFPQDESTQTQNLGILFLALRLSFEYGFNASSFANCGYALVASCQELDRVHLCVMSRCVSIVIFILVIHVRTWQGYSLLFHEYMHKCLYILTRQTKPLPGSWL